MEVFSVGSRLGVPLGSRGLRIFLCVLAVS